MNFISTLLEHLETAESPNSYIKWAGLAAIAAILRDSIFFKSKLDTIYPNIYVIIVAASSATRKDAPVRICEKLVREVATTKLIAGRASIQAVMRILSENYTNDKGHRLKGASGILLSKEFSDLVVDDPVAMKVITDWYDCHDHWDNNLITSGVSKLENVCITILAASNDVLFQDVFKNSEIYGGLLARSFIVSESRRKTKNSRMYDTAGDKNLYPLLVQHLQGLLKFKGAVELTEEAKKYYDEWYLSIDDEKFDRAGVIARMHTGVLKVSILLAAARENFKMVVTKHDVEQAIDWCGSLIKNYKQVTIVSGKSDLANPMNLILAELLREKSHVIQRRVLIQRLLGAIDVPILDRCVETLVEAEYLRVTQRQGAIAYELTQKLLESYEKQISPQVKGMENAI